MYFGSTPECTYPISRPRISLPSFQLRNVPSGWLQMRHRLAQRRYPQSNSHLYTVFKWLWELYVSIYVSTISKFTLEKRRITHSQVFWMPSATQIAFFPIQVKMIPQSFEAMSFISWIANLSFLWYPLEQNRLATFSAVTPIWQLSNWSESTPNIASMTCPSFIRCPNLMLGSQYWDRLIDSAPPPRAISVSPHRIYWAAQTIAWSPLPQRRFRV